MDSRYARDYRTLYDRHWWWRAREALILEVLTRLRPEGDWGRILDVGCGDGLFFERLSAFGEVEGIEMDPTGVTPGGRWAHRIQVQPFDDGYRPEQPFGLILMLDVLEHFPDPLPPLRRALELLEGEGRLVVTVPAFRGLWTSHDELNHHFTRFRRSEIELLTQRAGGRLESCRYFFQWTAPLKLAQHWVEKVIPARPSVPRVPPRWVNRALYGVSRLEQRVFDGPSPPFGTSLLAVAVRS